MWGPDRAGSPAPSRQGPRLTPTPVVAAAWFPALRWLSASLVSCRCRGKQPRCTLLPCSPHPWCALRILSHSHHCIWLPTDKSLNSVKNPFGELIFFIEKLVWGCCLCTRVPRSAGREGAVRVSQAHTPLGEAAWLPFKPCGKQL